jgi:NAD(P)-dependent dehydrogenase (short-subunit alcohol dehydrogenase family)
LRKDIDVNYIGAILTTLAFIPLLQSSPKKAPAKIMLVSSILGSAGTMAHLGPWVSVTAGYSASKAALNMFARKVAAELAADDSASVPREGGWAVGLVSAHLPSMPLDLQLTIMTASSSSFSSSFSSSSSSSDPPRCGSPSAVSRSVALLFP